MLANGVKKSNMRIKGKNEQKVQIKEIKDV